MQNYTVIDDDMGNKIYTYALNNAASFARVVTEGIKSDKIPELTNLHEVHNDLWAYCLKVQHEDTFTYSFRKLTHSKVTTNDPQSMMQKISAMFDKSGGELREFDGSVVSFDDKIDCIYIQNKFYVFYKKPFESILGLDNEFAEAAKQTLTAIKKCEMVVGLELLDQLIEKMPSVRKTLTKIAEKGNHTGLNKDEIQSINDVLKMFQDTEFKINEDGKIVLETETEAKTFLKLLNDYYKQGMTTKKYYTSDSGNVVDPAT